MIPCGNGPGAEAFQQHDVQELCRVLFDELESRLKGSPDQDLIKDLFQGFLSLSVVLPAALSRRCSPRSPRAVLCCCESVISMVPESALCVCVCAYCAARA